MPRTWSRTLLLTAVPQFLSPLQELPSLGRNPVYWATLLVFVVLQVPTALATNVPGIMILRFIAGFFASPALATGGATISDMLVQYQLHPSLTAV